MQPFVRAVVNQQNIALTKTMRHTKSISSPLDAGLFETGVVYNPKEFGAASAIKQIRKKKRLN